MPELVEESEAGLTAEDSRPADQFRTDWTAETLLRQAQALSDELAVRPNLGSVAAPRPELERFAALGLLMAPFPLEFGGLALGVEPETHFALLRLLAIVGSADLALGRVYEGHINGVLLVQRYGTREQLRQLAQDCADGMLSGVWNTGARELLHLHPEGSGYRFAGVKTFATGAAYVRRPVVTAELPGRGWQMTMPPMETLGAIIDRSFWHPLGMESSESFGIDFTGTTINERHLIGQPGDFYRDPMFRGGAVRFAAVQAGAILRLHRMFADWLVSNGRGEDPYQLTRLGEIAINAQQAVLWIERAAAIAEQSFAATEKAHTERMVDCANQVRTAIEQIATRTMQLVTAGIGAHGLLQPQRFERILRDLTMYLRQPAPDQTLAGVGRAALHKARTRAEGAAAGLWKDAEPQDSLTPGYFEHVYKRQSDPWGFETSDYERNKYAVTLASLPRERYDRGLEVGCSIGVLTESLAGRTDSLLGLDVSDRALSRARERLQDQPHVEFACMRVPDAMPDDVYDLIVVSEVAYYWSRKDLARAADELAARHAPGGHLVLVHLTEPVPDYPLRGDQVHDYWLSRPEWVPRLQQRHHRFRLDVLERVQ